MPAFFQLEVDVEVQVFEDGVGAGYLPTEPALGGPLQVVLALYMQICLEQIVHDYEAHLQQHSADQPFLMPVNNTSNSV